MLNIAINKQIKCICPSRALCGSVRGFALGRVIIRADPCGRLCGCPASSLGVFCAVIAHDRRGRRCCSRSRSSNNSRASIQADERQRDGARGLLIRRLGFECCYLLSFRSVSSNSFINVFNFLPLLSAWILYSSFLPFGNVTVKRSYFSAINLFCRSSCFSSAGFRVMRLSAPPFVRDCAPIIIISYAVHITQYAICTNHIT